MEKTTLTRRTVLRTATLATTALATPFVLGTVSSAWARRRDAVP